MSVRRNRLAACAVAATAVVGMVSPGLVDAGSISRTYVGGAGTGNWFTAGNWSPTGEPVQAEDLFISANDGLNRTAMYNTFNPPPTGYGLMLVNNTGAGTTTLLNFGNTMKASLLTVAAHGIYDQQSPPASSTFVSVHVNNGGRINVGRGTFNTVEFTHLAGTVERGPYNVSSFYRLEGGTLKDAEIVSNGVFDFVGGSATGFSKIINNGTFIYGSASATLHAHVENHGTITLLGNGSLASLQNFVPMTMPANRTLTAGGITQFAGSFTQSPNSVVQSMTANMDGGTWSQLGGRLTANNLNVGGANAGTYLLSTGTAEFLVASAGGNGTSGTIVQSGGVFEPDRMWLGSPGFMTIAPGSGRFHLSGGSVAIDWELIVGRQGSAGGVLEQTGGYLRTNSLKINESGGSSGVVTISDGLFESNSFPTHNNGLIQQSGGRSYFNEIVGTGSVVLEGSASLTCSSMILDTARLAGDARVLSSFQTNRVNLLTFDETGGDVHGAWDLVDGSLIVNYADGSESPLPAVRRYLVSGYANGDWNGNGLNTSQATATPARITALGYAESADVLGPGGGDFDGMSVDGSAVLVKYTYYGDANLNGAVNFDDYVRTDVGFNTGASGWSNGDFNYSGAVDFDDYVLIDIAFNTQSGTLRQAMDYLSGDDRSQELVDDPAFQIVLRHFSEFGIPYASLFLSSVPEPLPVATILFGVSLLRRRRHLQ